MSGPRADADLARSNRCRHTTLALERFGYWSVKTRAFDGRDVDGTEQPVRRLPCRLGQATVPGPENVVTAPLPRDGPTQARASTTALRPTGPRALTRDRKIDCPARRVRPRAVSNSRPSLARPDVRRSPHLAASASPHNIGRRVISRTDRAGDPGGRGHSSPALRPASSAALTPADGWADSPRFGTSGPTAPQA
jgi:hypothetical protein